MADHVLGQAVAQPAPGGADDADVLGFEADFFLQLPVQGLFRGFARLDATLGELPGLLADAARPQHLAFVVAQNDAHVVAEALGIDG